MSFFLSMQLLGLSLLYRKVLSTPHSRGGTGWVVFCQVQVFVLGLQKCQESVRSALDGAKLCNLNLNPPIKLDI